MYAEVLLQKFITSFKQSHTNFLLDLVTSLEPATHLTANVIRANNNNNNNNTNSSSIISNSNNIVNGNSSGGIFATTQHPNFCNTNNINTNYNGIITNAVNDLQLRYAANRESIKTAQSLSSNNFF